MKHFITIVLFLLSISCYAQSTGITAYQIIRYETSSNIKEDWKFTYVFDWGFNECYKLVDNEKVDLYYYYDKVNKTANGIPYVQYSALDLNDLTRGVITLSIMGNKKVTIIQEIYDNNESVNYLSDEYRYYKSEENKSGEKTKVSVGQILKTKYFEVTVNNVSLQKSVNTGNQFTDLKAEKGIRYLVFNTTFKNIDDESQVLIDGDVIIKYNGKDYTYGKSETILADGWGLLLDRINPLTSKTTNLVYKIPEEITGRVYYRPGRSGKDDLIFLGNLK